MPCPGSPLDRFAKHKGHSQFGEAGIIARLVELINPAKYCVEFGAWDGIEFSNCRDLIVSQGWSGLMIEADPSRFAQLASNYDGLPIKTLNRCVGFDGDDRLDRILADAKVPAELGLVSIDVDGADYHIWQAFKHYEPEIVVIEFNPTIPNDVFFVQERSIDVNHGSSLFATACLGKDKGYELVACTMTNAIFVRADKFPLTGVTDNTLMSLYRPFRDGRIFQGYDGTIHVVGMPDLVWLNMKLSPEDHQVIPKHGRKFSDARVNGAKHA